MWSIILLLELMGDPNAKSNLTMGDKVSVFLYRSGIILATLSLVYASMLFNSGLYGVNSARPDYFKGNYPVIVFIVFVLSVCMSVSFLHLYNAQILKGIRTFAALGVLILSARLFLPDHTLRSLFFSQDFSGKVGVIGLGFMLAGFAGIGAKEAFCFKLYEGYAYGILSAFLVVGHLFGIFPLKVSFILTTIITALAILFTLRKLMLPLYYDIGDKSRYGS